MRVEFGFLTLPGVYTATIAEHMTGVREQSSTVVLDGTPRNIQFGSVDHDLPGQVFIGEIAARGSKTVSVYDQIGTRTPDPLSAVAPPHQATMPASDDADFLAQRFLYWTLSTGAVSTHFYPLEEGEDALRRLLDCMLVYERRPGFPKVEFERPLTGGDIREPAERDSVTFHAGEETDVPWSVTFAYAGALASDSMFKEAGTVGVTRATALGVTVFCDGPLDRAGELQADAEDVAASLRLVEGDHGA